MAPGGGVRRGRYRQFRRRPVRQHRQPATGRKLRRRTACRGQPGLRQGFRGLRVIRPTRGVVDAGRERRPRSVDETVPRKQQRRRQRPVGRPAPPAAGAGRWRPDPRRRTPASNSQSLELGYRYAMTRALSLLVDAQHVIRANRLRPPGMAVVGLQVAARLWRGRPAGSGRRLWRFDDCVQPAFPDRLDEGAVVTLVLVAVLDTEFADRIVERGA